MQRRFIKIDSAENLYNETQLALEQISLTWSDIYFIKVKGELVSVENFRTFAEGIDFDPFSNSKSSDNINICFNNGSMLVRSTDKNLRKCYCFYDVNQSELTPAEIEQRYGKNYIKIELRPNAFEFNPTGKDKENSYFNIYGGVNLQNNSEPDFNASKKIFEKLKGTYKKVPFPASFSNETSLRTSPSKSDIQKSIDELKESMSEEDLENFNEEEFKKSLAPSGQKQRNPDGSWEEREHEDLENGGYIDTYEYYKPLGYYVNGGPIKVSGNDEHSSSSEEEELSREEISYHEWKVTYRHKSEETTKSWCKIEPLDPVDPNIPENAFKDEHGHPVVDEEVYNQLSPTQKAFIDAMREDNEDYKMILCRGGEFYEEMHSVEYGEPYEVIETL